jgi:hypothetical protein
MSRPAALISAARGIGDILRVMPLARVCMRPGYDVDLLLAPDYSGVAELLERVDGIRRVFLLRERWGHILTRDILFESRRLPTSWASSILNHDGRTRAFSGALVVPPRPRTFAILGH